MFIGFNPFNFSCVWGYILNCVLLNHEIIQVATLKRQTVQSW